MPAPRSPNTEPATRAAVAARRHERHQRYAAELRAAGWTVISPAGDQAEPAPYLYHQAGMTDGVPIEAIRWQPGNPDAAGAAIGWLMGHNVNHRCHSGTGSETHLALLSATGEVLADVRPGDWILRRNDGGHTWTGTSWTTVPHDVFTVTCRPDCRSPA